MSDRTQTRGLDALVKDVRACRLCRDAPTGKPLPHEPRPVLVASSTARICICGQAPGTRVHASGRPFTDPSGDRLRRWMGIGEDVFYDAEYVAIVPMGFCFPGLDDKGGDLPPRKECAAAWRTQVMGAMPQVELILLVGLYAQKWHLRERAGRNLTETVANWRAVYDPVSVPRYLPMPHPSWRNNTWLKRNPWFDADLLPVLRKDVATLTQP